MAVSSLYHYFPSKRDLALFPLSPSGVECGDADFSHAPVPLTRLRLLLDFTCGQFGDVALAMQLAEEMGEGGSVRPRLDQLIGHFEDQLWEIADSLYRGAAVDARRQLQPAVNLAKLALMGSPHFGLANAPAVLSEHLICLLRQFLVPDVVPATAFDEAVAADVSPLGVSAN